MIATASHGKLAIQKPIIVTIKKTFVETMGIAELGKDAILLIDNAWRGRAIVI